MEIKVLNTNLSAVAIVDSVESIVWNERYSEYGEFEIHTPMNEALLDIFQLDYYLLIPDSKKAMIVETIQIESDPENGDKLIIKGRSLESLLNRRIVYKQTFIYPPTNIDIGLMQLVSEGFTAVGTNTFRLVNLFAYEASTDPAITSVSLAGAQFWGQNVYDVISAFTQGYGFGFQVVLKETTPTEILFVYSMYNGKDRSYDQTTNQYVLFSPKMDNLKSASYTISTIGYKNFSWVKYKNSSGNENVTPAYPVYPIPSTQQGLGDREVLTDGTDISPFYEGTSNPIPGGDFVNQLTNRGLMDLYERMPIEYFEGVGDTTNTYKYGVDFYLGDIVQIEDQYGHTGKARITEVTISEDRTGKYIYPKFETV